MFVFDLETTGLCGRRPYFGDWRCESGRRQSGEPIFQNLSSRELSISPLITNLTGITDEMVADAQEGEEVLVNLWIFVRNISWLAIILCLITVLQSGLQRCMASV